MIRRSSFQLVATVSAALLAAACGDAADQDSPADEPPPAAAAEGAGEGPAGETLGADSAAVALLEPTEGNDVRGRVTFTGTNGAVRVVAEVQGLAEGSHGFHVHETGDCSAPDGSSAGGHFAPRGSPHGAPDDAPSERHVGDLGNLEAGADGTARYERVDSLIALSGETSILGRAVIVHGGSDDLQSQPSGDAGPRVACGVIESGAAGAGAAGGPATSGGG